MKILVTGGAGFLGKYIVKSLLSEEHEITVFDNFSNSSNQDLKILEKLNVKTIKGDITKIKDIDVATINQNIVIHLAAKISVSESVKNPNETFDVNVKGTKNVLLSCKKNHVKKVIVSSSAAVYGEIKSSKIKLTENSETNPISPYGKSKLEMEKIVKEICLKHKINYVILRIFNIFGLGQSDEYAGVISKFLKNIKNDEQLKIFGDGTQTRDFVSVDDVITAIKNSTSYNKSGIFNIASGNIITIKKLAETMISLSEKNLKIKYLPQKIDDIKFSQADISSAKREINYSPKFEIKQIKKMMKVVNNFKK
jgi:UDP-glucose 4-epimerase